MILNLPRTSVLLVVLACAWPTILGSGCAEQVEDSIGPASESALALPPLPDPYLPRLEPVSLEQIAAARKRVEADPADAEANGRLGMLYHVYKASEAAMVCYERAMALSPNDFRWPYYAAKVADAAGRDERAAKWARQAVELRPGSSFALVNLGEVELERGAIVEAGQAFDRALSLEPSSYKAMRRLGEIAMRQGRFEEAMDWFERSLAINPRYGRVHYSAALACARLGRDDSAARHMEAFHEYGHAELVDDPLLQEVYRLRTGALFKISQGVQETERRNYDQAIIHLLRALEIRPDYALAHINLANAYTRKGASEQALKHYRIGLSLEPDSALAHKNLGMLLAQLERVDEAIVHLKEAVRYDPDDPDGHYLLGNGLLHNGLTDQAIARFRTAIELDSGRVDYHESLAAALLQAERTEEAIRAFRRALDIDPDRSFARGCLGQALLMRGEVDEAIEELEVSLRLQPAVAGPIIFNLAEAYRQRGDVDKAIELLHRLVMIQPQHALARFRLGALLLSRNDSAAAKRHFEAAVRIRPDLEQARQALAQLKAGQDKSQP